MKKVLFGIILLMGMILPVRAEELYELIPVEKHATVETENFIYKDFYFNTNEMQADYLNSNHIIFPKLTNKSKEKLPITISISLFNEEKKNIGNLNYCGEKDQYTLVSTSIEGEQTVSYSIAVMKKNLVDGYEIKDIKYIAVTGENKDCSTAGVSKDAGKTVEEMKRKETTEEINKKSIFSDIEIDKNTKYFIYAVLGAIILLIFFFLFRNSSTGGMSRDEVIREEYRLKHEQSLKEKGLQPQPDPTQTPIETIPVETQVPVDPQPTIEQPKELVEESPKTEEQVHTDLTDLYK